MIIISLSVAMFFVVIMVTGVVFIEHMQKYKQKLLTLNFHLVDELPKINACVNDVWQRVSSEGYNI